MQKIKKTRNIRKTRNPRKTRRIKKRRRVVQRGGGDYPEIYGKNFDSIDSFTSEIYRKSVNMLEKANERDGAKLHVLWFSVFKNNKRIIDKMSYHDLEYNITHLIDSLNYKAYMIQILCVEKPK
jgi:hypothetical protein